MSLSVIIPTRNERHNIGRLLPTLLSDPYPPKEIIIVDNHSTDGTLSLIKNLARQGGSNTIVKLITKGHERSAQRNWGALKAQGTHLLFLDADMEPQAKLLWELRQLAARKLKAVVIPEESRGHDFWGKAIALERNCYRGEPDVEAVRFVDKSLFRKIGGYDEHLISGEDWDLDERLRQEGIRPERIRYCLIHHEAKGFLSNVSRKLYYTKHIGRYAAKHPSRFAKQSGANRLRIFWMNRDRLLPHPVLAAAFSVIKLIVYLKWKFWKVIQER